MVVAIYERRLWSFADLHFHKLTYKKRTNHEHQFILSLSKQYNTHSRFGPISVFGTTCGYRHTGT